MKKKLTALTLALLLSLSLFTAGAPAQAKEPLPDPTPVVTLQPVDPNKPGEPPAAPQGGSVNDNLPDPEPVERKID